MNIPVAGFDPAMRNWGVAQAFLDLDSGVLSTPVLSVIQPRDSNSPKCRRNTQDLRVCETLAFSLFPVVEFARVIFVEVPHGSQSARAMASYGFCVGILGTLKAMGHCLIEVSAKEVKEAFVGDPEATKDQMIQKALEYYPDIKFPTHGGKLNSSKSEHLADAVATIHAGVLTPAFQNLMLTLSQGK